MNIRRSLDNMLFSSRHEILAGSSGNRSGNIKLDRLRWQDPNTFGSGRGSLYGSLVTTGLRNVRGMCGRCLATYQHGRFELVDYAAASRDPLQAAAGGQFLFL